MFKEGKKMKKILLSLILSLMFPTLALAECPVEIKSGNDVYCASVEWGFGEKKVRGDFIEVTDETPYMIPMQTVPQKWVYSKAFISLWRKGDVDESPVELEGFKVFPFMMMQNGHNHSTSYTFSYVEELKVYELSEFGFIAMKGCWSLRWTLGDEINLESSESLGQVVEYKNLSPEKNEVFAQFCSMPSGGGHGEHSN